MNNLIVYVTQDTGKQYNVSFVPDNITVDGQFYNTFLYLNEKIGKNLFGEIIPKKMYRFNLTATEIK